MFHYNAFCILSNAIETKVGSFIAGYEYFFNWLRVEDEKEKVDKKQIENEGNTLERVLFGLLVKRHAPRALQQQRIDALGSDR